MNENAPLRPCCRRSRSYDEGLPPEDMTLISVVIPTLNEEARLRECLAALAPAAIDGLVKEVIVADGGSEDRTLEIADSFGAVIIDAPAGRGGQLKAGADIARGNWLLFLHGDTVLDFGWSDEVALFMENNAHGVGVFTLDFDAAGIAPKIVAAGAMFRTRIAQSPYGDQGLLMSKQLYEKIGGFKEMPLFEDVDMTRRIMRSKAISAFHVFKSRALTSAERYEREGYCRRVLKNSLLRLRYQLGASPEKLFSVYR